MAEVLTVEELVEKLDDSEKRKIPRIFYFHLILTLAIILGALALIGFTGYKFYKAEKVMEQYDAKSVEYHGDVDKFYLVDDLQRLQGEHELAKTSARNSLIFLVIYCVVSLVAMFLFHCYVTDYHWYYDEDVLHHLKKQKREKRKNMHKNKNTPQKNV